MKNKYVLLLITICIIICIFILVLVKFFNSQLFEDMKIRWMLRKLDSDDIREVKSAQSFFVRKGKDSLPILKNLFSQSNKKYLRSMALSLIGAISYSDYYIILCNKLKQREKGKIYIESISYIALEKLKKQELEYLYLHYNNIPNPNQSILRLLKAIKSIAKQKKWQIEISKKLPAEDSN